jgi:hypothetical protein
MIGHNTVQVKTTLRSFPAQKVTTQMKFPPALSYLLVEKDPFRLALTAALEDRFGTDLIAYFFNFRQRTLPLISRSNQARTGCRF